MFLVIIRIFVINKRLKGKWENGGFKAAILVFQNNETAAMLVFQTNPVGTELFSDGKRFLLFQ